MLKNIKTRNEKILKEYFEKALDGKAKVEVDWGFPISTVEIFIETESTELTTKITFDMLEDRYKIRILSFRTDKIPVQEGDEQLFEKVPDWGEIDSETINYFKDTIINISEQFFTTREQPKAEEPKAEEPKTLKPKSTKKVEE